MIFWVFRGIKGQKIVQNDKNSVRHAPYLRNHTLCDCHLWFTWLSFMFTSPDIFFSFSKVWFFRLLGGGKRTKNSPKWCKKFCLVMLYILGTIPHMIVIYGTHVWNDNISRVFFTFWKFWFVWLLEGLQSKIWFKMTKKSVSRAQYLRNQTSYDCLLWYMCMCPTFFTCVWFFKEYVPFTDPY